MENEFTEDISDGSVEIWSSVNPAEVTTEDSSDEMYSEVVEADDSIIDSEDVGSMIDSEVVGAIMDSDSVDSLDHSEEDDSTGSAEEDDWTGSEEEDGSIINSEDEEGVGTITVEDVSVLGQVYAVVT